VELPETELFSPKLEFFYLSGVHSGAVYKQHQGYPDSNIREGTAAVRSAYIMPCEECAAHAALYAAFPRDVSDPNRHRNTILGSVLTWKVPKQHHPKAEPKNRNDKKKPTDK